MSLMKKKFTNSSGTTSRSFMVGKNRLEINQETNGTLIFSFYDTQGSLTHWKLNSDDGSLEFPSGEKITIQRITDLENKAVELEGRIETLENA